MRPLAFEIHSTTKPKSYEIDVARGVIYVVATESWSPDGFAGAVKELVTDPDYSPDFRGFVNLRFLPGALPTVGDIECVVGALRPLTMLPVRRRCALLVRGASMLARARLFERLTSDSFVSFRAFESEGEAHAWIGVESISAPWLRPRY